MKTQIPNYKQMSCNRVITDPRVDPSSNTNVNCSIQREI